MFKMWIKKTINNEIKEHFMKKRLLVLLIAATFFVGCAGGIGNTQVESSKNSQAQSEQQESIHRPENRKSDYLLYGATFFSVEILDENYTVEFREGSRGYDIVGKEEGTVIGTLCVDEYGLTERTPAEHKKNNTLYEYFHAQTHGKFGFEEVSEVKTEDNGIWYVMAEGNYDLPAAEREGKTEEEILSSQNWGIDIFWCHDNLKLFLRGSFIYAGKDKTIEKDDLLELIPKIQVTPRYIYDYRYDLEDIYVEVPEYSMNYLVYKAYLENEKYSLVYNPISCNYEIVTKADSKKVGTLKEVDVTTLDSSLEKEKSNGELWYAVDKNSEKIGAYWGQDNLKLMLKGEFTCEETEREELLNLLKEIEVEVDPISLDTLEINQAEIY